MKKIMLLTVMSAKLIGALAQTPKGIPKLNLLEETYTFDTLEFGAECSHDFVFTNTGNETLILNNVTTACGCDVPRFDYKPVQPGAKSFVNYKYDSKRPGPFSKTMSITGNFEVQYKVIHIYGYVKPRSEKSSFSNELRSDFSLVKNKSTNPLVFENFVLQQVQEPEKETNKKKEKAAKKKRTKKNKYQKVTRNKMDYKW